MGKIIITGADTPGMRQILSRQDVLGESEGGMTCAEHWPNLASIPLEIKYFLLLFLLVRTWSRACDILEAHPALIAPWVPHLLQDVVAVELLSGQDYQCLRAHMFVLELARTQGIERARALLARFDT